jgi:ligand-binding sensor domain-containing protein/class 3 adenylate cyclase
MGRSFLIILCLFIISACTNQQQPASVYYSNPEILQIKGYEIPGDSLVKPITFLCGKPDVIKAGNPSVVATSKNINRSLPAKLVKAVAPIKCAPRQINISTLRTMIATENNFVAGIPEVIVAKEAHIMENNPYNFSSFGKLQGLKANTIYCMTQDDKGNLWFGTAAGVIRYDGNSFSNYTVGEGLCNNVILSLLLDKSNNLWVGTNGGGISRFNGKEITNFTELGSSTNNYILSIGQDRTGNIWFGTKNGALKYNGTSFTQYTEKEGLINNVVNSISGDPSGALWFGTAGGISKYDGHTFSNFTVKEGLCNNEVRSILRDKRGDIWFGTAGGVSKFDGKCFSNFSGKEGLNNCTVYSIFEDKKGRLWFGTWGEGVFIYDGDSITHFTEKEGLINNEVHSILQDSRGVLWFGTRAGGVSRYSGNAFEHYTSKEGLGHNQVQSILKDKKGNLWFGTWGGGACKYDGKSFSLFTEKEGLINNDVRSIIEDKNGNIWFGTWGGVSKFDGKTFTQFTEKNGLCNHVVMSMLQDKSGNLWFGTEGKGVSEFDGRHFIHFDKEEGLSGSTIRSMIQDKNGNIWFGTNCGVSKFNPSAKTGADSGTFTHYTETEGLPNNNIISLLQDHHGNIWIGSSDGGITKYDGKSFTWYTKKTGLYDDGIMSILEDKTGNLWFGTRTGISKLMNDSVLASAGNFNKGQGRHSGMFKNYTYEDGFYGVGCNTNSICEDNKGAIWIGANDRLTVYLPGATDPDTIAPNIQLTGIELFNTLIPWTVLEQDKDSSILLSNGVIIDDLRFDGLSDWYDIPENLTLGYNDNFIKFNFIGITTKSTHNIKYQYTLEGLHKNWITFTDQTSTSYGHLPDGKYTFRVKAMNSEGYWSEDFIYNFTILPPWWKTSWAYFFYTMVLVLGIILVDRIQTQRVISKERERIKDRELDQAREIEHAYEELHLQKEIVEKQKDELDLQKKRSDTLLLNILPSEVAEELKEKGFADAKLIDEVTVLFTDFKDFTLFSEKVSPQELVSEINECFSAFDNIMHKHGVEKIKTIGDSYMAAGGLPTPNQTHSCNVVNAALEIQQFMQAHKQNKEAAGEYFLEIRIGVHTGPVVAGIVGVKKFAYDIWGNTVNTASHMEKSSEIGRINISSATYQRVKDKFVCEYRGKIESKNKGLIDMYFVNDTA